MSEEKLPAVADNTGLMAPDDTAMVIAGNHGGFSEDDALAGMSPVMQGYVKSYDFFMYSDNGIFKLIDNKQDKQVWEGEVIDKAIIYYTHHTKSMKRGSMEGRRDKETLWTDEEKELVALSYDEKSKGNFELNNVEDYLKKPKWDAVQTKVYVFAVFPELPSGKNPVACSFGITTDMVKKSNSLANYRLQIEKIRLADGALANFPIAYLVTTMYHQPDKNDAGDSYRRVSFKFYKDKAGNIVTSHAGRDKYVASPIGLELWRKIKKTHEAAIEYAESGSMPMSRAAKTVEEPHEPTGTMFSQKSPDFDEIPFM